MAETLGFGLVGTGLVAPFHANSIRASKGGRLVAVCDVNRERADKLAATYGARVYYDLTEMLKNPEIKVVCVLTPNHLHHDAVMKCVLMQKHVIVEKPPAMSLRETDEMVDACALNGLKFACTVQCRVRKAIQAMKKALAAGRFGRLLHADAIMKWFRTTEYYHSDPWRSSRQSGAGVTVQHAFHYIDLLQYLAGPVASVEARMSNLAHPSVKLEDTLLAFVTYANGALGVVQASTALWPGTDVRIEINGEKGTAIMVGEKMATWKFREEKPEDEQIRQLGSSTQATAAGSPTDFGYADHLVVIQDMIDAIREGREVIIPVRSVRPSVELALALYQSAARNCKVNLPVKDDPSIWE
jgi:predicted dehydrogenase